MAPRIALYLASYMAPRVALGYVCLVSNQPALSGQLVSLQPGAGDFLDRVGAQAKVPAPVMSVKGEQRRHCRPAGAILGLQIEQPPAQGEGLVLCQAPALIAAPGRGHNEPDPAGQRVDVERACAAFAV